MNQQDYLMMIPDMRPEELIHIQHITRDMNDTQRQRFFTMYRGKRKEQQLLLILTLVGFFGVAGIQRFIVGEVGMGILYLLTFGFCGIGTIIDLINVNRMANEFNQKQADETAYMVKMMQ